MASRLLLSVCLSLVFLPLSAQNNLDALRYSLLDINGSARVQAMGGAFSALGGDVSSIGINPAASAVAICPVPINAILCSDQFMGVLH